MSVLINGMEMPRKCIRCPVNVYGRCLVNDDKDVSEATAYAVRDKDCPLVPVPKHWRLIEEADAIETAWMILRGLGYLKEENPQLEQTVREVFATAPAIEVE